MVTGEYRLGLKLRLSEVSVVSFWTGPFLSLPIQEESVFYFSDE